MPARAASRSSVEWRSGASPSGTSRAPIIPSTTRSNDQYAPAASSNAAKTKIERSRTPPSPQPIRARTPASARTSSQALRILRSATSTRIRPSVARLSAVLRALVEQPARRPVVVLRRVAAAGAVQRGDVLEGDEDVAVELDVRDLVDVAVRGEDAFLVLAAEQGDLDLLALVLARVVLHRRVSLLRRPPRPATRTSSARSSRRRAGRSRALRPGRAASSRRA